MIYSAIESPVGKLVLLSDGRTLHGLYMQDGPRPVELGTSPDYEPRSFPEAATQLAEYFAGARAEFDLPLAVSGSPFQLAVWAAVRLIPYGETVSYGELARQIDMPSASRAVGRANGTNPIPIIVPCHRVIGAGGTLTGYGGGVERKRWLLDLEARGRRPALWAG